MTNVRYYQSFQVIKLNAHNYTNAINKSVTEWRIHPKEFTCNTAGSLFISLFMAHVIK